MRLAPRGEASERRNLRWSGAAEIAAGALLVVVWAMLWFFFIAGVVEPAAGLQAGDARVHARAAAALPAARAGAGAATR